MSDLITTALLYTWERSRNGEKPSTEFACIWNKLVESSRRLTDRSVPNLRCSTRHTQSRLSGPERQIIYPTKTVAKLSHRPKPILISHRSFVHTSTGTFSLAETVIIKQKETTNNRINTSISHDDDAPRRLNQSIDEPAFYGWSAQRHSITKAERCSCLFTVVSSISWHVWCFNKNLFV